MLSDLPSQLPLALRSPRILVAIGLGAAAAIGVTSYILARPRPSPEEIERNRRDLLAASGRITDGNITAAPAQEEPSASAQAIILYSYRIGGVTYECAQDVSVLAEHVRDIRIDLPIQVRYDLHNPANSIVVAESWNGLRLSTHPDDHPETHQLADNHPHAD